MQTVIWFAFAPDLTSGFSICSLGLLLVRAASKTANMTTMARHSGTIRVKEGVTEREEPPSVDWGVVIT